MTKQDLLNTLAAERQVIVNAMHLSYVGAASSWRQEFATWDKPAEIRITLDGVVSLWTFNSPAALSRDWSGEAFTEVAMALIKVAFRNALNMTYESIQSYCLGTPQQPIWESAPWRPFVRLVRNAFSHNFILDFFDRKTGTLRPDAAMTLMDGTILTLSQSDHGKEIDGRCLSLGSLFGTLDTVNDWAATKLQ